MRLADISGDKNFQPMKASLYEGVEQELPGLPTSVINWFLNYFMLVEATNPVVTAYEGWKQHVGEGKTPIEFVDGLMTSKSAKIRGEISDFITSIRHGVKVSGNVVRFNGTLFFNGYKNRGELDAFKPPFTFDYVDTIYLSGCGFIFTPADIPAWIPRRVNEMNLAFVQLHTLDGINEVLHECVTLNIRGNRISSGGVLGLLLIDGLKQLNFDPAMCSRPAREALKIINQFIENGSLGKRAVIEAQSELLDAGLDEFARL